ncbi:DEAD/DEAH box helicase [Neiella sp. HB171785]|uniref:DEAD/DEAH box helicase n=1 Tax=Neiella litorisoli TaxID=2771431 RepID=A0A8J6QUT4_9GAMM|nr:DEAD/DEAH box helicase [Neiella litorisoli]MBD1389473.1 DEAD/DEAH box helicase [Neiella litorisoli]
MTWLHQSQQVLSKGLTTSKVKRMADLASRRQQTQSQFFTPEWVASGMWSIAEPAMNAASGMVAVMDNSVGSGRLMAQACPNKHLLYGCDTDERVIAALSEDATNAQISHEFSVSGMEDIEADSFGVGLINPPFSLTLSSPNMMPFDSAHYGEFGPMTNALSHEYSLDHALYASDVVVALLPLSMKDRCHASDRLFAEIRLPGTTFIAEGANVKTAVFVFGQHSRTQAKLSSVLEFDLEQGDDWPEIPGLHVQSIRQRRPRWKVGGVDESTPTITLPVTGDDTVELHHHNRSLVIKYRCGLVQAKVANALMQAPVEIGERHRYPTNMRYVGSGRLLLDVYLQQDDPLEAFESTIAIIRQAGGTPQISPSLQGYFAKLVKRHERNMVAFRKTVKQATVPTTTITAKRGMLLRQGDVNSPVIRKGEVLEAEVLGGVFLVQKAGMTVEYRRDAMQKLFSIDDDDRNHTQWRVVFEGKNEAFPDIAQNNRALMTQSGVDFLWPPQMDSLSELMMTDGAVAGWQQGTGKARLAVALCLTSTAKHNLIAVESGLVDEMVKEFKKIGLQPELYNIILQSDDIKTLKKINLISYNRLKSAYGMGKQTLAHRLRRRFGVIAADEGGILANPTSQQSRALMRLAPRKLFLLDGTPIGSYPRDLLNLCCAVRGSSRADQPYALRNQPYIAPQLLKSASYAPRGVAQFKDDFVVLDWASHEFADNLREGAKREIPAIQDVALFRQWAGLHVQRRLRNEPEMEAYSGCAEPERETHAIAFDKAHFKHYLKTAVEFSEWYMRHKQDRESEGKGSNLVAVLAKIQAVVSAANSPHVSESGSAGFYSPLTSKQRFFLKELERIHATGDKAILYAYCPEVLERMKVELDKRGIKSVLFTGKQNIARRNAELDREFREGEATVLLSSWVGQRGLNLPQANHVLLYNRAWTGDVEEQAIARVTRPEQEKEVFVSYGHLKGSIDEYMGQVVEWKIKAADAGLDFGDDCNSTEEFRHMDSVLEEFCRKTLNMSAYEAHREMAA